MLANLAKALKRLSATSDIHPPFQMMSSSISDPFFRLRADLFVPDLRPPPSSEPAYSSFSAHSAADLTRSRSRRC